MERWVEHYSKLYSRENVVTDEAPSAIEFLPMMDRHVQYSSLVRVEKLNIRLVRVVRVQDVVSVILFMERTWRLCLVKLHLIKKFVAKSIRSTRSSGETASH